AEQPDANPSCGARGSPAGVEDSQRIVGVRGDRGAAAPRGSNDEAPDRSLAVGEDLRRGSRGEPPEHRGAILTCRLSVELRHGLQVASPKGPNGRLARAARTSFPGLASLAGRPRSFQDLVPGLELEAHPLVQ